MFCTALSTLYYVSSPATSATARQTFKGYFHSLLPVLKSKFHTHSESLKPCVKGEFEVLVHEIEYAQIVVFLGGITDNNTKDY